MCQRSSKTFQHHLELRLVPRICTPKELLSRWSLFLFTTHAQLFLSISLSLIPFIHITFLFLLLYYHHVPSFYFSSYDSHQATGRQDCYCSLERRPTTPTADVKDQLHSQRPPHLVPQNQDSLPCPPPPPPLSKPWRPSHPNSH